MTIQDRKEGNGERKKEKCYVKGVGEELDLSKM